MHLIMHSDDLYITGYVYSFTKLSSTASFGYLFSPYCIFVY